MTGKLAIAQRLLVRLRTAAAALSDAHDDRVMMDAGWDLSDAALVARSLADLTSYLPEIIASLKTAVDHAGTPVEVDGYLEALRAGHELVAHTHRLAHDLDPHYGPHGRHPYQRR